MNRKLPNLDFESLREAYQSGAWTPSQLVEALDDAISEAEPSRIWISRLSRERLLEFAKNLEAKDPADLPLYGIPFAIKDNIDLEGLPTTAACPEYAYEPEQSAFVVQRLIDAGAIPIGKTNLDQFATGLVGVRSPYGFPANAYHPDVIPGGSSSGSAVSVARGFASFSLGTDTAGSGRIPASLNNLVGLKPSRGLLSCSGVIPACKTLDCVSIFANNGRDAESVLNVAAVFDAKDAYARIDPHPAAAAPLGAHFRFGVPKSEHLEFFGNTEAETRFAEAVTKMEALGGERIEIDFAPFLEAARLLYEGPWVAERFVAIEDILKNRPEILHPVTRTIIESGGEPRAADAFRAEYRLRELKRIADETWNHVDLVLTPTAGTVYTAAEVAENPIQLNSNLGYYTNFMNLLDYSAVACPSSWLKSGVPIGITLFGPVFQDRRLLDLVRRYEGNQPIARPEIPAQGWTKIVVCGAHMQDLPLNHQLTERCGRFLAETETSPDYNLYALPATDQLPPRPGLIRVETGGAAIHVEVWALPTERFGDFVAQIPSPLGVGKVQLASGIYETGFLCESFISPVARNITEIGNWRKFIRNG